MKTISYTYMREHLTEILDALRLGEEITVTQRGKADLVLSALKPLNLEPVESVGKLYGLQDREPRKSVFKGTRQDARERGQALGIEKGAWKVVGSSSKGHASGKKMSFSEAKERTKSRHAGVIKMLGDK